MASPAFLVRLGRKNADAINNYSLRFCDAHGIDRAQHRKGCTRHAVSDFPGLLPSIKPYFTSTFMAVIFLSLLLLLTN